MSPDDMSVGVYKKLLTILRGLLTVPFVKKLSTGGVHNYSKVHIFKGMEEIRELIEKSFTPRVEEDMSGIKVIFTSTVGDGTIWFEPAKRGWSNKPLSTNRYIIVDAELSHVLTFLNRYYQLDESNYHDIRRMFIDIGMDTVDKHTKGADNI